MQCSRKSLVLLNSPPKYISLSLLLLHSLFPPLYWQETLRWEQQKDMVEELQPDLSCRKVSHQKDVSPTALLSSLDKFEDLTKEPSPLTIPHQERDRMGKENQLNTAHVIRNLFALFRGFGRFEGHHSLHALGSQPHNRAAPPARSTVSLLHQLHVSVHLQGCLQTHESCWQWLQGICSWQAGGLPLARIAVHTLLISSAPLQANMAAYAVAEGALKHVLVFWFLGSLR